MSSHRNNVSSHRNATSQSGLWGKSVVTKEKEAAMLTQSKIVHLETVTLTIADIAEALYSGIEGVCLAVITPDVAEFILEKHNFGNRNTKRYHSRFLKGQIQDAKFVYNGETISFGDDANLLDGQHRLMACVAAESPIHTLVVFGVRRDAFTTVDTGARRSQADVLGINGEVLCCKLAGCLRQIDNYFKGGIGASSTPGNKDSYSDNSYCAELLEKYPDARESVRKTGKIGRLTRPSLAAALHYLFSQLNEEQADEFFDVVMNGIQIGRDYESVTAAAADKLRQRLLENAMTQRKLTGPAMAGLWSKAWNAARSGRIPKLLVYKDAEGQITLQ